MTSQLSVFNKALRHLEERKLASLTESRESLRYLTDEWSDAITYCLYQAPWNFAIMNAQVYADQSQAPTFGYEFCFTKPGDCIKTFLASDNESYNPPLRSPDGFDDKNLVWFANISPIYVMYVSNLPSYGMAIGSWPPGFVEYLSAYLAWLVGPRLKQDANKVAMLYKLQERKKREAVASDALDLMPSRPPYNTWVMSRAPRGSVLPMGPPFPWSGEEGG
jgi:hypothetical protein